MSILLFDVKVSLSGDDSDYIIGASEFWHHFTFPSGHGAVLYQIILSPFVGLFGMNLIVLKSISALCAIWAVWLLYRSFRDCVPAAVLAPSLLLVSICAYVFFYASHTYSEMFFMLMQGLFIYFFALYFLVKEDAVPSLKTGWRTYLITAALILGVVLARPIGYGILGAVILFFGVERRWRDMLYLFAATVCVFAFYQLLKSILWPGSSETLNFSTFFLKDPYNPTLGMESPAGMLKRFTENSQIYLSAFLYQFMGLIPDTYSNMFTVSTARTVAIYLLYAGCIVITFRRNKALLFAGIYAGVMNFASFIALQSMWAQDRLIMIYYPFILLFFLGGIWYLFQIQALKKAFFIYPLLLLTLCYGTLSTTRSRVKQNLPVLQQNLLGDKLYGLTPDWANFIKGSQWVTENLDKDAVIVSRKPTLSKVYTGRDFTLTPTALTVPADTLALLKDKTTADRILVMADASKIIFTGEPVRYIISYVRGTNKFSLNGTETIGVCVYAFPNESVESRLAEMAAYDMAYTFDFDDLVEQCRRMESVRIYDPDLMLRYLEDNGISYLLLPQLRVYPTINSGEFINDVHRYRDFISFKYPGRFRTIHTIGEEEPCEIVEFIH
jgi:MFS family permease